MICGVVGLGIIGGSFAKAIKEKTSHRVIGFNRSESVVSAALSSGAIDAAMTDETICECDLIIVALPPKALVSWAEENGGKIKRGAVLVDACGVKRAVVSRISPIAKKCGFVYVGGHPMAGKEVSGFCASDAKLYEGASMILTPENVDESTVDGLKEFFLSIGFSRVTITTPEEHDAMIAYTSQLAHVASSAYIKSPSSQLHAGFSAGSFRDLTRVARLDENLWTELFFDNSDFLLRELDTLIYHLNEYRDALSGGDREKMRELLKNGREMKEKSAT